MCIAVGLFFAVTVETPVAIVTAMVLSLSKDETPNTEALNETAKNTPTDQTPSKKTKKL
jgi:hypothetical protein